MKEQGGGEERKEKGRGARSHILSSFMILFNTVRKHSELTAEA